jgi:hypothetical protein
MNSEHWQQVDRLFQAALEIDPSERRAFLEQKCLGNDSLRSEVESLLDYDRKGLSIIDAPAFDMVANLLGTHAPELSVGQHIGHYKILNLLGSGGMGEVYLAQPLGRRSRQAIAGGLHNRRRRFAAFSKSPRCFGAESSQHHNDSCRPVDNRRFITQFGGKNAGNSKG